MADCPERRAETIRAQSAAALDGRAEWPAEIIESPAVKNYLLHRNPRPFREALPLESAAVLEAYSADLKGGTNSRTWQ